MTRPADVPPTRPLERADAAEAFIARLVMENDTETLSRAQLLIEDAYRAVAALRPDTRASYALNVVDPDVLSLAGVLPVNADGLADALNVASGRFLVAAIRRRRDDARAAEAEQP